MTFNPKHPLLPEEIKTFGVDSYRHEITGECVEVGSGALPVDVQAAVVHCAEIERREGKAVADEVRRRLDMHIRRPLKK
jgi:hypothetical protein